MSEASACPREEGLICEGNMRLRVTSRCPKNNSREYEIARKEIEKQLFTIFGRSGTGHV